MPHFFPFLPHSRCSLITMTECGIIRLLPWIPVTNISQKSYVNECESTNGNDKRDWPNSLVLGTHVFPFLVAIYWHRQAFSIRANSSSQFSWNFEFCNFTFLFSLIHVNFHTKIIKHFFSEFQCTPFQSDIFLKKESRKNPFQFSFQGGTPAQLTSKNSSKNNRNFNPGKYGNDPWPHLFPLKLQTLPRHLPYQFPSSGVNAFKSMMRFSHTPIAFSISLNPVWLPFMI